ncbi:hypothetical protein GF327_08885 [Candidatus Woesearchaeota archaeon]|nr:hypothetical protein [Candidatus Woesearchaeota archaeon]
MDKRKIQRSGTTYYVYLPSAWCRENNITKDSVISIKKSSKGELVLFPEEIEKSDTKLKIDLSEKSIDVINKIIIASYINPLKSFEIKLDKPLSSEQVLEHKKLLGGLELVDFEDKKISCQTTVSLTSPDLILLNMIKKIINIISLIRKGDVYELIERYEEEIDKSNLLIHKVIISSFMFRKHQELRNIDLFYIGLISKTLEQLADDLIEFDKVDKFLTEISTVIKKLEKTIQNIDQKKVVSFVNEISSVAESEKDSEHIYKKRIISQLNHICEILSNWMITNKIDS